MWSCGYLYFHCAPDSTAFDKECRRLLNDIHLFDVLRSDRSISSHGLEARTPFLDRSFIQCYLSLDPNIRHHALMNKPEKYLIRTGSCSYDSKSINPDLETVVISLKLFNKVLNLTKEIYDVEKMSKIIIGSKWEGITSKDKTEFIKVFEEFVVTNYFRRFSKLKELSFIHKETKVIGDNFILVKFNLKADEDVVYLDYLMHGNEKKWRVFDILLDGSISEIATKKSDFKKIIDEKGIRGLITDLKLRNKL